MNLAEYAIRKKAVVLFGALVLTLAGVVSYFEMGKLEDPEFSIKTAVVTTSYPGASSLQVEQEVTDVLETVIQRLPSLKHVRSASRAGKSTIWVDLKESYRKEDLPQLFDELRKKVTSAKSKLPPGAGPPVVSDDFGDVYGILLAVVSDGIPYDELKDYADDIRRELLLVRNVARVELWGQQQEVVRLDASRARLEEMGISGEMLAGTLMRQNMVLDAGSLDVGDRRMRIRIGGEYDSVQEIGEQLIRGPGSEAMVRVRDVASVTRGYVDPPVWKMRFNGRPSIGLAISTVSGGNVIDMGRAVRDRLDELVREIPVGVSIETVAYQPEVVEQSINDFMLNLIEAVVIVIALLLVFMGLSSGVLIGLGLILTICITFAFMSVMNLTLDRVTLGALIVALGMLVDNAIVVTEGMLVRMQHRTPGPVAASLVFKETAWPLLGATLVAAFAFLPIYMAPNNTGEYCVGLFLVVTLSLLVSWVLAVTVTPILCDKWLRPKPLAEGGDPYAGRMFRGYRRIVRTALAHRTVTLLVLATMFGGAVYGFTSVKREFFPESKRPQLMIDYWLPEGTDFRTTDRDLRRLERVLMGNEHVRSVATYAGAGPHRFYLPLEPQGLNPGYGYLLVNLDSGENLDLMIDFAERQLAEHFPDSDPRVRRFPLGAPAKFKIEARFRGPDPAVLHDLAEQSKTVMRGSALVQDTRDDWRNRVLTVVPGYSAPRALQAGLSRKDLADGLKLVFDGMTVGLYRENNRLIPITLRTLAKDRERVQDLTSVAVRRSGGVRPIPVESAVDSVDLAWRESVIRRYDRQRCITAQCDPVRGVTMSEAMADIGPKLRSIVVPKGYTMEWGGTVEKSADSNRYVMQGVPLSFLLMAFVVVALFNGFRQPLIILCVLPLALIGVSVGLLSTGQPFGFMALLGFLSLSGMLIKNAVVLLEQIDAEIRGGKKPYQAILDSAVSRMRPVLMAAISTVLGMTPLIFDRFWVSMAVTICFGLTFATILTLVVVPVLYSLFFRVQVPEKG